MRLFVAVWPTPEAVADLDAALDPVRAADDARGVRWQPPSRWHLTIAFLGEVGEERCELARDRVARTALRHRPTPPVRLAGAGAFGRGMLWVGLRDADAPGPGSPAGPSGLAALAALARSVQGALRRSGFAVEERAWRPHLTLARMRSGRPDPRPLARALASYEGPPWSVASLALVRSTTGPQPRYDDVAVLPLGRADPVT